MRGVPMPPSSLDRWVLRPGVYHVLCPGGGGSEDILTAQRRGLAGVGRPCLCGHCRLCRGATCWWESENPEMRPVGSILFRKELLPTDPPHRPLAENVVRACTGTRRSLGLLGAYHLGFGFYVIPIGFCDLEAVGSWGLSIGCTRAEQGRVAPDALLPEEGPRGGRLPSHLCRDPAGLGTGLSAAILSCSPCLLLPLSRFDFSEGMLSRSSRV